MVIKPTSLKNNGPKVPKTSRQKRAIPVGQAVLAAKGGGRTRHPIEIRLKEIGRTRKWLAEVCGCSPQTITSICKGRTTLPPGHYLTGRIKHNLGVSLDYLVLGPDCIYG